MARSFALMSLAPCRPFPVGGKVGAAIRRGVPADIAVNMEYCNSSRHFVPAPGWPLVEALLGRQAKSAEIFRMKLFYRLGPRDEFT